MKYRVKVFCVGRPHRGWLKDSINSYEKRLRSTCVIQWLILKSTDELKEKLKSIKYYCFDVTGGEYTSESFSKLIKDKVHWNFVIGGACGIPSSILQESKGLISLSRFTFTHEIVRLLITEQIYRALEIAKGSAYHK